MAGKVENFQHQKIVKLFGRFIQAGLANDLTTVNAIAPDLIDALDASTTEQERHRMFSLLEGILQSGPMKRADTERMQALGAFVKSRRGRS